MESRDLLIEILSRLPVKVLCKFKCVSKFWYNLISDPGFKRIHHDRAKRKPHMLFRRNYRRQLEYRKVPGLHLSTMDDQRKRIQNHFTTMIEDVRYVYPSGFDLVCFDNGTDIYICNPSTHEFKKLPDYSPSVHPFDSFAFGYLPSSNEYKLVHLFSCEKDEIQCKIFSIRDGGANSTSWKLLDRNYCFPHQNHLREFSNVSIDGILYWLVANEVSRKYVYGIISLDMEIEEFRTINIPKTCLNPSIHFKSLMDIEGIICLVDYVAKHGIMHIWKLKDHQNHFWVMQYSIDFNVLNGVHEYYYEYPEVLGVFNGEMFFEFRGWLYHYNIKDKIIRSERKLNIRYWDRHPFLYTDSFFSLGTRTI